MSIFKCKMCGGTLEINNNESVATCEYCGTQQTLPKLDDERRVNLYDRANHFRRNNEFDKAMGIYEQILNEDNTDAEAYWSLVLCRYGIEYVEDPATHKRVPTVNRAQFTSVYMDEDYKSALQYADGYQKQIYEEEAKAIDDIQKGILEISAKEEPFDVFICYKETDANGRRTPDSVLANDLYHQLTQEGFKVFFARITLEDKLGSAYEPYIFAALNSAKVMVVLGTKPEYFNAVWVKNEWSRYLSLVKVSGGKKMLIPAYKDMDPYDLPDEFSHLQAQDMSKLGFMQDLIRGIKKIAQNDEPKATVVKETVITAGNANTAPLLKRAFMFLEDGDWDSANEYCEKVLDVDPECAEAYLGKLMAELHVISRQELKNCSTPFDNRNDFQKAMRFADANLKNELQGCIDFILNRNLTDAYNDAVCAMQSASSEGAYINAAEKFNAIKAFLDSEKLAKECLERAEEIKKRAEEETERVKALYKEYKVTLQNEKNGKKREADKRLSSLNEQYNTLICLKNDWQSIEDKLFSLNERLESISSEIASLRNERSRLGIFAVKQKSEIDNRISILGGEQTLLMRDITAAQERKQGYQTISELDNGIDSTLQQLNKQKKIIEELSCSKSSQSIRDELSAFELGKKLLRKYDFLQKIVKGSYITFGSYRQSDDISKGKEGIEWLVLEVKGKKALVISKYALDCKPYNESNNRRTATTWETCTLRRWLNKKFIKAAFSADERAMIATETVSAEDYDYFKTINNSFSFNATKDQVFLLSKTEVKKYFKSDDERKCAPTDYARARGATSRRSACEWWLRSPGQYLFLAASVLYGGVYEFGNDVTVGFVAVRPALWIDLSA